MPANTQSDQPLPASIRDQALAWLSLTHSGNVSEAELLELQGWRERDIRHELAWQRMVILPSALGDHKKGLNNPIVRSAVQNARYTSADRRQVLKMLVGATCLGATAWYGKDSHLVQGQLADLSTATGERHRFTLSDGTQLWLNTGSAVDIRYSASERRILVRCGEVDILTGADPALRVLVVETANAEFRPLGTRFTVRIDDARNRTLLAVSSGRVKASFTSNASETVVEAGRQVYVDASGISNSQPLDPATTAWINGFIIAERQRLGDFVQELARYHQGIMRCAPEVADVRLTGSYPLDNPERILTMLERSLPVRIQRRTRYWVTFIAA